MCGGRPCAGPRGVRFTRGGFTRLAFLRAAALRAAALRAARCFAALLVRLAFFAGREAARFFAAGLGLVILTVRKAAAGAAAVVPGDTRAADRAGGASGTDSPSLPGLNITMPTAPAAARRRPPRSTIAIVAIRTPAGSGLAARDTGHGRTRTRSTREVVVGHGHMSPARSTFTRNR